MLSGCFQVIGVSSAKVYIAHLPTQQNNLLDFPNTFMLVRVHLFMFRGLNLRSYTNPSMWSFNSEHSV